MTQKPSPTSHAISRRKFIQLTGITGAALTLGIHTLHGGVPEIITPESPNGNSIDLNAWISIDTLGKVTITNHRSEMGQGSWQSVPQIIAEELEVDLNQVKIIFAQGNSAKYGSQITGGSSTIRGTYKNLLRLSATARQMLIEAAAIKLKALVTEFYAESGKVIHKPTGKSWHYGELVEVAATLTPPTEVKLKSIDEYKILRKPLPRQDTPLKTNGTAVFGLDFKLPGMMYAVVERSPRFQGKVKSFDDTETRKVPGVKNVFKVQMSVFATFREGVAVVADSTWAAMQGRKVLKVVWDDAGFEHLNSEQLYTRMRDDLKSGEGLSYRTKGNFTQARSTSTKKLEAHYETPYESHSCMEPLNCTAYYQEDKVEIWGPIQGPDWVQDFLSPLLNLPKEKIIVNMTFLGGGFGRKAFMDYPHEAAVISKEIKAPVQVVWSREDDTTQGPFRPGMVYACEVGISDGRIQAFKVKIAGQDMDHQWPAAQKDSYLSSTTEGFPEPYFNSIPHYSFSNIPLDVPIPVMWWRSVYASTNGFAFESFLDELAIASETDPLDFRRNHLGDERYQKLIDKLEAVSGWKSRKKNEGYGVAITECFSSIVGEIVKVSRKSDGKLVIDKVWAVMDCGWYVNPDIIQAQVEGSIIMALGAATIHATQFADGMAVQKNFNTYPLPRIVDTPIIEVHIMENEEKAGGVGEPGLPPFTPALTNAIFDLTGKRIRNLPFKLTDV